MYLEELLVGERVASAVRQEGRYEDWLREQQQQLAGYLPASEIPLPYEPPKLAHVRLSLAHAGLSGRCDSLYWVVRGFNEPSGME